jgi:hypothetical protein
MAYLEQTQITNEKDVVVNPASEESIVLLRRIAKTLESQAAADPQQRQRVVLDATATVAIAATQTLTTVTTVGTVTSMTNLASLNGWNQQMFADPARHAYNSGIRSQLTFS